MRRKQSVSSNLRIRQKITSTVDCLETAVPTAQLERTPVISTSLKYKDGLPISAKDPPVLLQSLSTLPYRLVHIHRLISPSSFSSKDDDQLKDWTALQQELLNIQKPRDAHPACKWPDIPHDERQLKARKKIPFRTS